MPKKQHFLHRSAIYEIGKTSGSDVAAEINQKQQRISAEISPNQDEISADSQLNDVPSGFIKCFMMFTLMRLLNIPKLS